jgi:hypothetical protein
MVINIISKVKFRKKTNFEEDSGNNNVYLKMKVLLSIPLIILISFSGISVKLATHYCGSDFVAVKISLSGKQATCGMEPVQDYNSSEVIVKPLCCEDIASEYTINNIFIPSTPLVDLPEQRVIEPQYWPANLLLNDKFLASYPFACISPPGTKSSNSELRPILCIFRI